MADSKTISIVCNTTATLLGLMAFGLSIASAASSSWVSSLAVRQGLWITCSDLVGGCAQIPQTAVQGYLNATRAFMILSVIFNFLACLVNLVSQFRPDKKAREGSGGIFLIAASFAMIGAAIYTSLGPDGGNGVGFAFAWTVMVFDNIAGICQIISARKAD